MVPESYGDSPAVPQPLQRLITAASALVLSVAMLSGSWLAPPAARANNVRLADVDSGELREGTIVILLFHDKMLGVNHRKGGITGRTRGKGGNV